MINQPRRRKQRQKFQRGIFLLPSVFTVGNLFCGYYSLVATLHGDYAAAGLAVVIAIFLDGLDGRIARLTNSQTAFGMAFDSLADVLTFGLAPAALIFSWGLWDLHRLGWLTSFFFLSCGATRLARFTVQTAHHDRRYFVGLPIPPAAGLLCSLPLYYPVRLRTLTVAYLMLALVVILSFMMISKVRYRSFKDIDLKRPQRYSLVALLAFILWLIANAPRPMFLLIAAIYAASGPAERLWLQLGRRRVSARRGSIGVSVRSDPGEQP
ncbi:MAG: CDP-diacylglycerol--serine O-phosphatidyltransferase [Acidobacteriota bacterium]